jgi:hypothetical protein
VTYCPRMIMLVLVGKDSDGLHAGSGDKKAARGTAVIIMRRD